MRHTLTTHPLLALFASLLLLSICAPCIGVAQTLSVQDPKGDIQNKLVIYSTTDTQVIEPVLRDYVGQNPSTQIIYHDLDSLEIYERVRREQSTGHAADIVLSSAMDLQLKLANDGYARHYQSANTEQLPRWANWRNEAFAITYEPAVSVYNRQLLPQLEQPMSRTELSHWLTREQKQFYGKIISYDPARSGVGFLLATQDAKRSRAFWQLTGAFGLNKIKLFSNTQAMLERVASGRSLIAYNVLGSYAHRYVSEDPNLALLPLNDYLLVLSRVAILPHHSGNPQGGEAFLDYLLSTQGQRALEKKALLSSIAHANGPKYDQYQARRQPVPLGTELMVYLDQAKRRRFLQRWDNTLSTATGNAPFGSTH